MTVRASIRAGTLVLALAWSVLPAGARGPLPTADEVVARHLAARGGVEAWKQVKSVRRIYEIGGMTIAGLWAGDRTRMDQFTDDQSEVSATIGDTGWTQRPSDGQAARGLAGAEASDVRERAALGLELLLVRELKLKVAVAGEETLGRTTVIRVSIESPAGRRLSLLLDAKTWLEVARAHTANGPDGAEQLTTEMGDYRPEGGILMPHQIGPGFVRYKINEPIDPGWFEKPR